VHASPDVALRSAAAGRPAAHYTARVIPAAYDGLRVPLELPLILWQP